MCRLMVSNNFWKYEENGGRWKMILCEIQVKEERKKTHVRFKMGGGWWLVSFNCYSALSVLGGVSSKKNKTNILHYNMFPFY